jgi:arginase
MTISLVVLRCRTSDRTDGAGRGAEALGRELGERLGMEPRIVGSAGDARPADWSDDLRESRGCILEAGGQVDDALARGAFPLLLASDCSICLTTLAAVARHEPEARFLWLDAHGDFNTPDTTPSGFLGGMCLGAACGRWDAGWPDTIDPESVSFFGVRDLDPGEKVEVEAAGVGEGVPADGPVYVHLDLDGLDPSVMPVQFPVPGGLQAAEVRHVLARLVDEGRLVGLEVTAFEHPEHLDLVLEILEPVTR